MGEPDTRSQFYRRAHSGWARTPLQRDPGPRKLTIHGLYTATHDLAVPVRSLGSKRFLVRLCRVFHGPNLQLISPATSPLGQRGQRALNGTVMPGTASAPSPNTSNSLIAPCLVSELGLCPRASNLWATCCCKMERQQQIKEEKSSEARQREAELHRLFCFA